MRAVSLDDTGSPRLVERPEPGGDGVLVHVGACGLCGSDTEKLGDPTRAGAVLGHELEGALENGSRVTVMHRVPCGRCERCGAGHGSTCAEFALLRIDPGGFAERLRATHVVPLPDALGELDGIWVEPVACVLRALDQVPRGAVHVAGCGAIGLLWTQVLLRRGDEVTVSDPRDERRRRALELGAAELGGEAAAVVLTAHAGTEGSLRMLAPGGTLLLFCSPATASLDHVYRRELQVVGSRSAEPAHFDAAVALLPSLALPPVEVLPLERFAEGLERYRSGAALKVAFVP
ncbi:MAG TPA: alcohol dehydrogenase catalytic domain-containing protein [Gaiellaceae bacterium]|nr:alcohol dehydrogenase catalytic domain-containing protein [Gaiellaceae bacterium]